MLNIFQKSVLSLFFFEILFEMQRYTNEHELLQKNLCDLYEKQRNRQESIDLLQGRIPKAVFVRHYYRPDLERFEKIRDLLDKLYNQITP